MTKLRTKNWAAIIFSIPFLLLGMSESAKAIPQCTPGCHLVGNQMTARDCVCPNSKPILRCKSVDSRMPVEFHITDTSASTATAHITFDAWGTTGINLSLMRQPGTEKDEVDYVGTRFKLSAYINYFELRQFPGAFTGLAGGYFYIRAPLTCALYLGF